MKAKELRAKLPKDLGEELLKLRREQFNLRMARATGQAAKPDQFAKVRKNIARVKTVLAQSKAAGAKHNQPNQRPPPLEQRRLPGSACLPARW
jgi:large subunit ribosomal protein L29